MLNKTLKVEIKERDILLLDGKCLDSNTQEYINSLKTRINFRDSLPTYFSDKLKIVCSEIFVKCIQDEYFSVSDYSDYFCKSCDKKPAFSQFKRGPRKGQNKAKIPIPCKRINGQLRYGFSSSYVICKECFSSVNEILVRELLKHKVFINETITPKYRLVEENYCYKCKIIRSKESNSYVCTKCQGYYGIKNVCVDLEMENLLYA